MRISFEGQADNAAPDSKGNCLKVFENFAFKIFEING